MVLCSTLRPLVYIALTSLCATREFEHRPSRPDPQLLHQHRNQCLPDATKKNRTTLILGTVGCARLQAADMQ
jgi:hypothetical protein